MAELGGIASADVEGAAKGGDLLDSGLAAESIGQAVEQRAGDFVGRQVGALNDLGDGAVGEEIAVGDVSEPVTALGFVHVMGGDENGEAPGGETMDLFPEIASGFGIDAGGGFVEEEELWLMDEAGGEGETLFPAAGEFAGELLTAVREAEGFEAVVDGLGAFGDGVDAGDEIEVFLDGEVFVKTETLGHVTDLAFDGSGGGTDVMAQATAGPFIGGQ